MRFTLKFKNSIDAIEAHEGNDKMVVVYSRYFKTDETRTDAHVFMQKVCASLEDAEEGQYPQMIAAANNTLARADLAEKCCEVPEFFWDF